MVANRQWGSGGGEEAHRLQVRSEFEGDVAKPGAGDEQDGDLPKKLIARDFFGRPIMVPTEGEAIKSKGSKAKEKQGPSIWVTYHEGYSNAVRKPLTLAELMKDM